MSEQIPDADGNDDLDGDDDDDDGGDDDDGDCNVQGWPFIDHCLTSLFLGCATRIISIAPGLIILIGTMIIEDDDDDNDDDYDDDKNSANLMMFLELTLMRFVTLQHLYHFNSNPVFVFVCVENSFKGSVISPFEEK